MRTSLRQANVGHGCSSSASVYYTTTAGQRHGTRSSGLSAPAAPKLRHLPASCANMQFIEGIGYEAPRQRSSTSGQQIDVRGTSAHLRCTSRRQLSTMSGAARCSPTETSSPTKQAGSCSAADGLILGLSVGFRSTGFAIVRYETGAPQRFALIRHGAAGTGAPGAASSSASSGTTTTAAENITTGTWSQTAKEKFVSSSSTASSAYDSVSGSVCVALERLKQANYPFTGLALEDTLKDRSLAAAKHDLGRQIETGKMQGVVLTELKRLWPGLPLLQVHPQRAREQVLFRSCSSGGRNKMNSSSDCSSTSTSSSPSPPSSRTSLARDVAREQLFAFARKTISNFPSVKTPGGKTCDTSFFLSDAWAVALYARLELLVEAKQRDPRLVLKLRKQILELRRMKTLEEQIRQLHPRKAASDLEEVLESQVQYLLRTKLYQMCAYDAAQK
ncbi:unnamed protein product [Amoebophrya sp. A120]|nr:unnamed protein product [Amoebophrya sp. A120]|eukprot:GSA120T00024939001.1